MSHQSYEKIHANWIKQQLLVREVCWAYLLTFGLAICLVIAVVYVFKTTLSFRENVVAINTTFYEDKTWKVEDIDQRLPSDYVKTIIENTLSECIRMRFERHPSTIQFNYFNLPYCLGASAGTQFVNEIGGNIPKTINEIKNCDKTATCKYLIDVKDIIVTVEHEIPSEDTLYIGEAIYTLVIKTPQHKKIRNEQFSTRIYFNIRQGRQISQWLETVAKTKEKKRQAKFVNPLAIAIQRIEPRMRSSK